MWRGGQRGRDRWRGRHWGRDKWRVAGPNLVESEGVEAVGEGGHGAVDPPRCCEGRTEGGRE